MKQLILVLTILLMAFTSCEKDQMQTEVSLSDREVEVMLKYDLNENDILNQRPIIKVLSKSQNRNPVEYCYFYDERTYGESHLVEIFLHGGSAWAYRTDEDDHESWDASDYYGVHDVWDAYNICKKYGAIE